MEPSLLSVNSIYHQPQLSVQIERITFNAVSNLSEADSSLNNVRNKEKHHFYICACNQQKNDKDISWLVSNFLWLMLMVISIFWRSIYIKSQKKKLIILYLYIITLTNGVLTNQTPTENTNPSFVEELWDCGTYNGWKQSLSGSFSIDNSTNCNHKNCIKMMGNSGSFIHTPVYIERELDLTRKSNTFIRFIGATLQFDDYQDEQAFTEYFCDGNDWQAIKHRTYFNIHTIQLTQFEILIDLSQEIQCNVITVRIGAYMNEADDYIFLKQVTVEYTSYSPTTAPTVTPTFPSYSPSKTPSYSPTLFPSYYPTQSTQSPVVAPSTAPTAVPSISPTTAPTLSPVTESWECDTLNGWTKSSVGSVTISVNEARCQNQDCIKMIADSDSNIESVFVQKDIDLVDKINVIISYYGFTNSFDDSDEKGFAEYFCTNDANVKNIQYFNEQISDITPFYVVMDLSMMPCNKITVKIGGKLSGTADFVYLSHVKLEYQSPTEIIDCTTLNEWTVSHPTLINISVSDPNCQNQDCIQMIGDSNSNDKEIVFIQKEFDLNMKMDFTIFYYGFTSSLDANSEKAFVEYYCNSNTSNSYKDFFNANSVNLRAFGGSISPAKFLSITGSISYPYSNDIHTHWISGGSTGFDISECVSDYVTTSNTLNDWDDVDICVRCCSLDGTSGNSDPNGVCYQRVTFQEAESICNDWGMRLCTKAELIPLAKATGCNHDSRLCWTSDKCQIVNECYNMTVKIGGEITGEADYVYLKAMHISYKSGSRSPTVDPTVSPSYSPTKSPTIAPSISPSVAPSVSPSVVPSILPSSAPTFSPTTTNNLICNDYNLCQNIICQSGMECDIFCYSNNYAPCSNQTIQCPFNANCNIYCLGPNINSCKHSVINCPSDQYDCSVYGHASYSSQYMIINGGGGDLMVSGFFRYSFDNSTIYCPSNTSSCSILGIKYTFNAATINSGTGGLFITSWIGQDYTFHRAIINAQNAFSDTPYLNNEFVLQGGVNGAENVFMSSVINCPLATNVSCIIKNGESGFRSSIINGGGGDLSIYTMDSHTFYSSTINCPLNPSRCELNCINSGQQNFKHSVINGGYGDLIINAQCVEGFSHSTINCPYNAYCNINCRSFKGCDNMIINGTKTHHSILTVTLYDGAVDNLNNSQIWCPQNALNITTRCMIEVKGTNRSIIGLDIYAVQSFLDLSFKCWNTQCIEKNENEFVRMHCTNDYSSYCDITAINKYNTNINNYYNDKFQCKDISFLCNTYSLSPTNSPTQSPTNTPTKKPTLMNVIITKTPTDSVPTIYSIITTSSMLNNSDNTIIMKEDKTLSIKDIPQLYIIFVALIVPLLCLMIIALCCWKRLKRKKDTHSSYIENMNEVKTAELVPVQSTSIGTTSGVVVNDFTEMITPNAQQTMGQITPNGDVESNDKNKEIENQDDDNDDNNDTDSDNDNNEDMYATFNVTTKGDDVNDGNGI
eukprot:499963_1